MSTFQLVESFFSVKQASGLNRRQILMLQQTRLSNLLKHVLQYSPFYKNYYHANGIFERHVGSIKLHQLPPINKKMMMDHYDEFTCDRDLKRKELEQFIYQPSNYGKRFQNKYRVTHSSGSTGSIGLYVYGPRDWNILKALAIIRVAKAAINPFKKTKLCFVGAIDGHYAGISLAEAAPRFLFNFMPFSINSNLASMIEKINAYQPQAVSGYSSSLYLLALEQLQGRLHIHPQRVICSGDHLTTEMAQTIEQAFKVKPVRFYAASESICMAADCDKHTFHLFDDWHCFEIVDEQYHPVSANQQGKLVLTNLYNYTQPLIRYLMNDDLVVSDQSCDCGLPFPAIKSIAGRHEEFLWFDQVNGEPEFIHPLVFVEFHVPGLEQFQIIQTQRNQLLMKVVMSGNQRGVMKGIHRRMKEILAQKGLEKTVRLQIQPVTEIDVHKETGKFKLIIPHEAYLKQEQSTNFVSR